MSAKSPSRRMAVLAYSILLGIFLEMLMAVTYPPTQVTLGGPDWCSLDPLPHWCRAP